MRAARNGKRRPAGRGNQVIFEVADGGATIIAWVLNIIVNIIGARPIHIYVYTRKLDTVRCPVCHARHRVNRENLEAQKSRK